MNIANATPQHVHDARCPTEQTGAASVACLARTHDAIEQHITLIALLG